MIIIEVTAGNLHEDRIGRILAEKTAGVKALRGGCDCSCSPCNVQGNHCGRPERGCYR